MNAWLILFPLPPVIAVVCYAFPREAVRTCCPFHQLECTSLRPTLSRCRLCDCVFSGKKTLSMTCWGNNVHIFGHHLHFALMLVFILCGLFPLICELQNNFKYVCLLCWFYISMPAFKAFWKVNDLQYITLCRSNEKLTITASYYNVIISMSVFTF